MDMATAARALCATTPTPAEAQSGAIFTTGIGVVRGILATILENALASEAVSRCGTDPSTMAVFTDGTGYVSENIADDGTTFGFGGAADINSAGSLFANGDIYGGYGYVVSNTARTSDGGIFVGGGTFVNYNGTVTG